MAHVLNTRTMGSVFGTIWTKIKAGMALAIEARQTSINAEVARMLHSTEFRDYDYEYIHYLVRNGKIGEARGK